MQGRAPPTYAAREKRNEPIPSDNTGTGQLWADFSPHCQNMRNARWAPGWRWHVSEKTLGNLSRGVETGSPAMTLGPLPARHPGDSGLPGPSPLSRAASPAAYLREPGHARSRRAAAAVVERTGYGHIRRVPSPGDGAPGRPRIAALAPRASGHAPQSPASWPVRGPAESGREVFPPQARSVLTPAI